MGGTRRGATYATAGVDIEAGDAAVARIRDHVASTARPEVLGGIGGFGASFAFDPSRYAEPVLVSSTDGVGTKAAVAAAAARYDTIGIDLVAMCVDDIVCAGAEPLFLLDYITTAVLDPDQMEQLVAGVAHGCRVAGCALVGGEMAEHPGTMAPGFRRCAGIRSGHQNVRCGVVLQATARRGGDPRRAFRRLSSSRRNRGPFRRQVTSGG